MRRMRQGVTMVELLVALAVLLSALLGAVAIMGEQLRRMRETQLTEQALSMLTMRIEMAELIGCVAASGREQWEGITTAWRVMPSGSLAVVDDSVSFPSPFGARRLAIRRWLPCP